MTGAPNLKTGPRRDRRGKEIIPSMHTFALRHPWYWERLRWLRKWTIENWAKRYVLAEGPPGQGAGAEGGRRVVPADWEPHPELIGPLRRPLDWGDERVPHPHATENERRVEVNGLALAEAISSEDVKTGKHHILIDIDRPAVLIPSTSNNHFHLYVEMGMCGDGMKWEDYAEWLRASAKIGLIEKGYAEASIRRRATFLRLPWVRKGHEAEDRQRALGWWLEQPEEVDLDGGTTVVPDSVPF